MAAGRFSVEAVFKGIDKISRPVSRMQNRISKFTRRASNSIKRLNKQTAFLGKTFKTALGVAGIAGGLFLMQAAMVSVIQTGIDFEQTLTNAAAKFPEGIKRGSLAFKQLEQTARKVGATTEFTASQAAGGLNFLAMAGFTAEQSIAALPAVVDLATAAQIDLATASDIATDSLGAFGLATKDADQQAKNLARINDVLAKTATTANTDITGLFEAIKEGAPVATAAGQSLETFAAFAGQMANAGIKGGTAGTTLKNIFVRLTTASGSAAKSLKKMGVVVADAQGNTRDAVDIFADLEKGLDGLGTAERSRVLANIFGRIPLAGVNVLLKTGSARLREYREELLAAGGAASLMAAIMRATLGGSIKELNSATEGLQLTIFEGLAPALKTGIVTLTGIVRAVDGFLQKNKDVIPVILEVARNLSMVIGVLLVFKLAIIAITAVMALNPFGLIVIALGALVALLPLAIRNFDKIKAAIKPIFDMFMTSGFGQMIKLFALGASLGFRGLKAAGSAVGSALGIGGPEGGPEERQTISPEERTRRWIETNSTTNKTELRIKDDTGRAELEGSPGPGIELAMSHSGSF